MFYVTGTPRGSDHLVALACSSATLIKSRHMIEVRTPDATNCFDFVIGEGAAEAQAVFDRLLGAIDKGDRLFRIN